MLGEGFHGPSTPSRNRPHGNLMALRIAVVVLFGILAAQLVNMQIIKGADYARRSAENHLTKQDILPARGLIYDRNGTPLVANEGVYTATLTPLYLPSDEKLRYEIYRKLELLLGVPPLETQTRVKDAEKRGEEYLEIAVKSHLAREQAMKLEEAAVDMPGVALRIKPGRNYIAGDAFAHILGYVGDQFAEDRAVYAPLGYNLNEPVGKDGLEAKYEKELRGQKGVTAAEQDAQGSLIKALKTRDPVPGNGLQLNIDADLQNYVAQLLETNLPSNTAGQKDARNAAAVVMDAKTGAILSLVSIPTYDNNLFANIEKRGAEYEALAKDPRHPFQNQAIAAAVAPGSTFKLVTASAALQTGLISPATSRCIPNSVLLVKGENGVAYPLVDWKAHGCINLTSAIAWSSNIYMFMASCGILGETRGLGKNAEESAYILGDFARQFGFGQPTGIDIGGETDTGIIPSPAWLKRIKSGPEFNPEDREWYYANTCFMGIGQGDVTATPLQVARMTAAVATGGKLFTPHVVKEVLSPDGKTIRETRPEWKQIGIDSNWLAVVRQGMHESVIEGAGARAKSRFGFDFAGKTGTAEFGPIRADGHYDQHAWFTGFAPYNDPQYVVTVYFDYGVGGDKAAPVGGAIMDYIMQHVQP